MNDKLQLDPMKIEEESMAIIDQILAEEFHKTLDADEASIIKRCIHTSADFAYADNLYFSENAIAGIIKSMEKGATIVTDTNMALSGINKAALKNLEMEAFCYIADEQVAIAAREKGITRAIMAVEKSVKLAKLTIYVVGNAPTALIRLYELIEEGYRPEGIIAVPVGFVNVVESKEMIIEMGKKHNIPVIVARGRKGGSNIAAAIINALMYKKTRH